jgi:hypothetical protein
MLLGLVLLASPVSAQWHVTAFLGDAATSPGHLDIRSASADTSVVVEPVGLRDESFDSPWYYGARLTRQFEGARRLGLEVEFIHAKTIADPSQVVRLHGRLDGRELDGQHPLGTVLPRFELSHGLNFLLGNVVVDWPVAPRDREGILGIVGRVGAGPTIPHVESTFRDQQADSYQFGAIAFAAAFGTRIRLSNHFSAVVELKVTRTRQRVDVGSADIEGVFTTRHFVAGVTWRTTTAGHRPFIR